MTFFIVSPYSPRTNNIASRRWEKLSKYISRNYKVVFLTSRAGENNNIPDLGNAELVEIPIKKAYGKFHLKSEKANISFWKEVKLRLKAEARIIMERLFPLSTGGILWHDEDKYLSILLERVKRNPHRSVLVTTYDPWFSLKIGSQLKKEFGSKIIWIADFRDPSFNVHESVISKLPIFKLQTKRIIKHSDMVTVVTNQMVKQYSEIYKGDVLFLPNGYDGEITQFPDVIKKKKDFIKIVYTGSLHKTTVEIAPFFKALNYAAKMYSSLRVEFVYSGKSFDEVNAKYEKIIRDKERLKLKNLGLLPHDKAIELQKSADLLLLISYTGKDPKIGEGLRTGKVYEYLCSGKPILVLGLGNWELKDTVESDGISKFYYYYETKKIAQYITKLARMEHIELKANERLKNIDEFSYKKIADKFLEHVKNIRV